MQRFWHRKTSGRMPLEISGPGESKLVGLGHADNEAAGHTRRRMTTAVRLPMRTLLETAHALADLSGKVVLPYFRRSIDIDNKAADGKPLDPVTEADRAAERTIRRHLAKNHPEHGIVGEEFGQTAGTSDYTWVIDPIDGTKAFITGTPLWGTLIGLKQGSAAVLGMMNQPFTGERIWSDGKASMWRQPSGRARKIETRECRRLEDAVLATTSPDLLAKGLESNVFNATKAKARLTRYGGDCYAYCLLAAGHIDIILECGLKPYDVVALIPIIESAGGRITTWDGRPATEGGRIIACGDPRLHDAMLRRGLTG